MPMKIRNYKQEYKTAKARGENGVGPSSDDAKRKRLRREALKKGKIKPSDELNHKKPLVKGGANTLSNAEPSTPSKNRSFRRNKDGSMK